MNFDDLFEEQIEASRTLLETGICPLCSLSRMSRLAEQDVVNYEIQVNRLTFCLYCQCYAIPTRIQ